MARILVVGDAAPGSTALLSHAVTLADGLSEALEQAPNHDIVLVDGERNIAAARAVCSGLRAAQPDAVILLLVGAPSHALITREWGFDDFISATADATELDARVRLIAAPSHDGVLAAGPIRLDEGAYTAHIGGEPIDLTYTEFELLRYLMHHRDRVLTREVLLSEVWGYDYYAGTRTVDVHIRRLRAKLGQYESWIGTVRNVGYRFASSREARS